MTHISYETAKLLKAFLGESAPGPISHEYYRINGNIGPAMTDNRITYYPAYQLHDLLSEPFCEAFGKKHECYWNYGQLLFGKYYHGGLPAVEKALLEMIGE